MSICIQPSLKIHLVRQLSEVFNLNKSVDGSLQPVELVLFGDSFNHSTVKAYLFSFNACRISSSN